MRRREDALDPAVARELDALDAALRGEAVDPEHAELAELAVLLQGERETPRAEFARELDARAADRFAPQPSTTLRKGSDPFKSALRRFTPSTTAGLAVAAMLVVGVVVAGQFGSQKGGNGTATSLVEPSAPQRDIAPAQGEGGGAAGSGAAPLVQPAPTPGRAAPAPLPFTPARPSPGPRKIQRTASLTLTARPRAI